MAHGWRLTAGCDITKKLIGEFIRPAVRAVPPEMARALGRCRVTVVAGLGGPRITSRWSEDGRELEIRLAAAGREEHDIALELLVCLGQALWSRLSDSRRGAYWRLVEEEIRAGVTGEIDGEALARKRRLLADRASAANRARLEQYGEASFAGTAAEYVHALWHDVTVRTGAEYLPAEELRRRLELVARWYPAGRGYRLFGGR
jgi:hypothetical protein